ncbi:hypothetical protein P608_09010 [Comamonas thiooxydans]|uniref:Uncharacterized protein n=1 Tax=Comamonas thiooxydans TaxID=363952 RepID=A0A0E3BVL7_9BURK|nr:hypothetical protein P608_09010 [Comamonas thiooxydans]
MLLKLGEMAGHLGPGCLAVNTCSDDMLANVLPLALLHKSLH